MSGNVRSSLADDRPRMRDKTGTRRAVRPGTLRERGISSAAGGPGRCPSSSICLGGFECRSGAGDVLTFPTRKVRALLAYLATNPAQGHRRDKLADLFGATRRRGRGAGQPAQGALAPAPEPAGGREGLPRRRQGRSSPSGRAAWRSMSGGSCGLPPTARPETMERAAGLYRGRVARGLRRLRRGVRRMAAGRATAAGRNAARDPAAAARPLCGHRRDRSRDSGGAAPDCARSPAGERPSHADPPLHVPGSGGRGARPVPPLPRRCSSASSASPPEPETERLRAELSKLLPDGQAGQDTPLREADDLPERSGGAEERGAGAGAAPGRAGGPARRSPCCASPGPTSTAAATSAIGMADDIATELGRFRELDVIAPTIAPSPTAMRPCRRIAWAPSSARRTCSKARLRRAGERLRITVRLVETDTARQLWAERYDCAMSELFDLQDEVARRIVATLVGRIEDARLEAARRAAAGRPGGLRSLAARLERPETRPISRRSARRVAASSRRWRRILNSRAPMSGSPWRT